MCPTQCGIHTLLIDSHIVNRLLEGERSHSGYSRLSYNEEYSYSVPLHIEWYPHRVGVEHQCIVSQTIGVL